MKRTIERITRTAMLAVAFMLCATTSAWADATLLNYMNFDTLDSNGVAIQKDDGTINPVKIDGNYVNYTTTANAKLGAHAYQANNGTIGLQDNTSGLVSMSGGWTISFWFHPNTTDDWRSFFGFGLLDGNNYHFVKSGAGTFTLYGTSSSADPTKDKETLGSGLLVGVAFTASAWNHIAIVSQPVDGEAATVTATLYVNGSSAGTFTMPSGTSLREVLLCIGRNNSGANSAYYRSGYGKQATWFDDFALFGGVLSDAMIATIAAGRSTVTDIFTDYEENKTISISGDTTFTVDNDMAFETISVENTSEEAATLTFTGSYVVNATQINVPANVTVKVDSAVSGTPVLNAPVVLSEATSTLEIAAPATISKTISGSGKVVVSANPVEFTAENTFSGGLIVANGGNAKTTSSTGYGPSGSTNITVQDGGALDVANTGGSNYGAAIEGEGILVDSVRTGALYSSANYGDGAAQWYSITLNGNATIKCNENYNWGLLAGGYNTTALNLGTYTLTKAGGGDFWLSYATISGSGTLSVSDGKLKPIARPCTGSDATIEIGSSGQLKISANSGNYKNGTLTIKNISCASGGSGNRIEVDSNKTLTVSNAMTVNGSASVAGTLAGAGTATVTSTGTMSLTGACTISSLKVDRSGSITVKDGIAKAPTAVGANDQVKGVAGTGDTTYSIVKVAKTSDDTEYYTMEEALAAINASSGSLTDSITLIYDTTESFEIPRSGFVLDTNGHTSGAISGASGVGVIVDGNVYTGGSNTAATWTGSAGDNLWSNAQNWSTKSVPTSATTVTFDTDATVEMGETAEICGLVVNSGKTFTLYRTGNSAGNQNSLWATLKIGAGQVNGGGTVKLICAGISKTIGSFTINANIEFQNNGTYDSFLEGTAADSFTINGTVTGSGYLQVKTSTTFNGNVTIPSGSLIQVNSWTYNLGNNASLYGAGTLKFNAVDPSDSMRTALQNKDKWTGVCEIYNKSINHINANNYGNVNSTVRYNGVTGYSAYSSGNTLAVGNVKCIDIGASGLTYNDGFSSNDFGYTYACALTGTGTITFGSTYGGSGTYTFTGDASAFAGTISYGTIAADKKAAIVFNSTDNASPTVGKGQLGVAAGTTLGLAGFTGTVVGSGTIAWTTPDPSSSVKPTFDSSWTGTVVLPSKQGSMTVNLAWWGVTGSRIKVMGFQGTGTGNSVKIGTDAVAATVELAGNVRLQNGDDGTTYTIAALTGTGDFNTTLTGTPSSTANMRSTYSFTKLTDYTGTISTVTPNAGEGKTWWTKVAIGTVNVSSLDLTSASPIVKLGGTHNLESIPTLTVNDAATSHELYQAANGNLYVKVASVTVDDVTTYYSTLQAAADAAMAAGGETITFTRIDSEAGTSLPGWTYEDGVFTRTGYAYNATTKTEYSTLAGAVAAASEGDTIQLMYGNSETAVDTTGKDFVFDENGYAFTGTWTGSGRIVLSAAPSTTTWSSGLFVSSGEGTTWTGTVTLDWEVIDYRDDSTTPKRGDIAGIVNKYGIAASTVEIGRNSRTEGNCYFNADTTPKLKVSGFLYINDGSSTTKRTVSSVCGEGVFVFGDKADTVNYGITNLDDWNGILTNKSAKVTVGTVTRGDGVIYCSNNPTTAPTFTDTEGNRWTGRFIVGWNQTSSAAFAANSYGISGSTVEIPEDITIKGFIPSAGGAELTVSPTIDLSGSLTIDNGYGASGGKNTYTTFAKITGKGRLTITDTHQYYFVDTLENWDGELSCSGYNKIVTLTSGTGLVKFGRVPTAAPTTISDSWRGVVSFGYQIQGINLNLYGTSNSTVALAGVSGNNTYLPDTDINVDVRIDGSVTINNGNPINTSTDSWEHDRVVKIDSLEVNAALSFVKSGNTSWGDLLKGWYYAEVLKCGTDGRIDIGNQFGLRIDAVDLVEAPSASSCVIPISLTRGGADKSDGVLYGPNGVAGEVIPVTVGGVANGQKLVHATVNETTGLYLAVASVTVNETTTYYPTLSAVKTQFGDSAVTINLLENTSESVELAYGQVLDTGTTTYTGTVSAADPSAKIIEDGTTYKVRYGTIFSVW